jgi:outer membrane protein assembly factor BamE (lipoprotein component of BamABCDE complex)
MFVIKRKHFKILFTSFLLFLIGNCQLQESKYSHGVNFLENREKVLILNKTNKNDVVKYIGRPHSVSLNDEDKWMYFERTTTKGKMHKLGRNVLQKNNVLELKFNKYGLLVSKKVYRKDDMKKIIYSENETENTVAQQSAVGKFLSSIRQKMYGKRKF